MTPEQKAIAIAGFINNAQALMKQALTLADNDVAVYIAKMARETDYRDEVSGTCLGFADALKDLSNDFFYTLNDVEMEDLENL